ncbi:MAG: hypothetical protein ACRC0Q_11740 [Kurthia gibsonii]
MTQIHVCFEVNVRANEANVMCEWSECYARIKRMLRVNVMRK